MNVKALKDFISTTYGNVSAGQVLSSVPASLAQSFIEHRMVEEVYETKVIRNVPVGPAETSEFSGIPTDAGEGKPSSSSPADQAPTKKTRGRRKQRAG